jgi:hypothetical protein
MDENHGIVDVTKYSLEAILDDENVSESLKLVLEREADERYAAHSSSPVMEEGT